MLSVRNTERWRCRVRYTHTMHVQARQRSSQLRTRARVLCVEPQLVQQATVAAVRWKAVRRKNIDTRAPVPTVQRVLCAAVNNLKIRQNMCETAKKQFFERSITKQQTSSVLIVGTLPRMTARRDSLPVAMANRVISLARFAAMRGCAASVVGHCALHSQAWAFEQTVESARGRNEVFFVIII